MQHERIGLAAEFCDNEFDPLRHESADKMHVPREAIELTDEYRHLEPLRALQGLCELRATIQSVGALAGLDLGVPRADGDPLALRECLDGGALAFEAEA